MSKKISWAIVGAGKHACQKIIPAFSDCQHAELSAVVSSSEKRAERINNKFQSSDEPFETLSPYSKILERDDISAIFISLPNSQHSEFSKLALEAGKHVLCEKPLALSSEELNFLNAAKQSQEYRALTLGTNSTFFAEGMMFRFHPQQTALSNILKEQKLGKLRLLQANIHYCLDPNVENIRNKPELGGGILNDIGCYAVDLANRVFGTSPIGVSSNTLWHEQPKLERSLCFNLCYPEEKIAQISLSAELPQRNSWNIYGETGSLHSSCGFFLPRNKKSYLELSSVTSEGRIKQQRIDIPAANSFSEEIDAFSKQVLYSQPELRFASIPELNTNAKTLEMIRESMCSVA